MHIITPLISHIGHHKMQISYIVTKKNSAEKMHHCCSHSTNVEIIKYILQQKSAEKVYSYCSNITYYTS